MVCRISKTVDMDVAVKSEGKNKIITFDFELDANDTASISSLDTATSSFFSHRDPAIVKWMSERKLDIDSRLRTGVGLQSFRFFKSESRTETVLARAFLFDSSLDSVLVSNTPYKLQFHWLTLNVD